MPDASVLLTVTERAVVESPGKSRPFVDVYAVARDPSDANVVTVHWIKSSAGGVGAKVASHYLVHAALYRPY